MIVELAILALILAAMLRLVFRSFREERWAFSFRRSLLGILVCIGAMFSVMLAMIVYQNHINPAVLANVTLENGAGQKVVFVKMSHIATEEFYEKKRDSLRALSADNFVFLTE